MSMRAAMSISLKAIVRQYGLKTRVDNSASPHKARHHLWGLGVQNAEASNSICVLPCQRHTRMQSTAVGRQTILPDGKGRGCLVQNDCAAHDAALSVCARSLRMRATDTVKATMTACGKEP